MPYLKVDIVGYITRQLYGKAGSLVNIIYDHGNVKVVQDKSGNKFYAHEDKLSDDPIPCNAPAPQAAGIRSDPPVIIDTRPIVENTGARNKKKSKPSIQTKLL